MENPKARPKNSEKEHNTQYHLCWLMIETGQFPSREGRKVKLTDASACPGLCAQDCHLRCGLRSSQLAGELNSIIWGQRGQKVIWGTGCVGPWVCDYEETRLRAGRGEWRAEDRWGVSQALDTHYLTGSEFKMNNHPVKAEIMDQALFFSVPL